MISVLTGTPTYAAGQRTRRVTIQQRTQPDTGGPSKFPIEVWTDLDVEYMARQDIGGDERFRTGKTSAVLETRWTMVYRPDMDPERLDVPKLRRLSYEGRFYDILTGSRIRDLHAIELVTIVSTAV